MELSFGIEGIGLRASTKDQRYTVEKADEAAEAHAVTDRRTCSHALSQPSRPIATLKFESLFFQS
jgi:hypothetical protein